jgi:DNA-binding GntR family transcriptional regulator
MNIAHTDPAEKTKAPTHELVYQKLRDKILFGDVAPGEAVTIQGLVRSLDAGMTPVREAIRRLIAEGALRFQGNRRVCVPELAAPDIEQIGILRKAIEPELARRAAQRICKDRIDELKRIDAGLDAAIRRGDIPGYLRGNYTFHDTLYLQADASILHGVASQLWLRFGPSLRVVCGRFGTENLPDRHKDILTALEQQDPSAAAKAMEEDVMQGTSQMIQAFAKLPDGQRD